MSKLYFLTFANSSFMTTMRIREQAKKFNLFDYIIGKTEKDIPEFIEKHKDFINKNSPGYGFWIWKPKIILDLLNEIHENDYIVYCDAGVYLNSNGVERFKYYLSTINEISSKSICVFSCNGDYKAQYYVKNDVIMNYYPDFNNELENCCYAGLMIIRKNEKTVNLISEWLKLCENYNFLDKSVSTQYSENSYYKGNDCDNGIFNVCLSKYKDIVFKIYPDETNIYINGLQLAHTDLDKKSTDWSSLDNYPFQIRRMTPKLGF